MHMLAAQQVASSLVTITPAEPTSLALLMTGAGLLATYGILFGWRFKRTLPSAQRRSHVVSRRPGKQQAKPTIRRLAA